MGAPVSARPSPDLARRLAAVLREGGPRKPNVLEGLAEHLGYDAATFRATVEKMRGDGHLVLFHRSGGPHYAIANG